MNISNCNTNSYNRALQQAYGDLSDYTCPHIMQKKYNLKENKNFTLSFNEFKDIIEKDTVYNKNNSMEMPKSFVWADTESKNMTLALDANKNETKEISEVYDMALELKKRAFELGLVSEKSLLEVSNFYHEILDDKTPSEDAENKKSVKNSFDSFDCILKMYDKTLKSYDKTTESNNNINFKEEFKKLLDEKY